MGRMKTLRFSENLTRENIIEEGKEQFETIKGNWHKTYFKNENPIVLELACGRGEYTVGLARQFPDKNFIGIDIKGDRIWDGSGVALQENLKNVAFLRTHLLFIDKFFAENEVSEIWIVFPDPRPRERDRKRRLTSPRFLKLYQKMLVDGGLIRLKTDNTQLYEYTLNTVKEGFFDISNLIFTDDLYNSELFAEHFGIQTRYEKMWLAKKLSIKYLKFNLGKNMLKELHFAEHQEDENFND